MKIAAPTLTQSDVFSIGLTNPQGILKVGNFDWNLNDATRAFSARFADRLPKRRPPTHLQAGVYAAVLHFLKAAASGVAPLDGRAVVAQMKRLPVEDPVFGHATIRADGRVMETLYLFRIKSPAQSRSTFDQFEVLRSIPADQAFRPEAESVCKLWTG
jgi:branched-chain amino acid transport system substrate-binding protein